jgi:hypothetical protein
MQVAAKICKTALYLQVVWIARAGHPAACKCNKHLYRRVVHLPVIAPVEPRSFTNLYYALRLSAQFWSRDIRR